MSHSLWFHPLAAPLGAAGFKIVGADRRGTGQNIAARGDAPSGKALLDDAAAIIAAERTPGRPVYLVGWCWGAVLGINLAAEMKGALAGLSLLAPGLFPTGALKQRMAEQERLAADSAAAQDVPCLESPISEEMFTSGPALTGFIRQDPQRLAAFTPRFLAIMGKMAMGARLKLPKLAPPIQLVLASDDAATDNPDTERGFAQMTGGRVVAQYINGAHGLQFDAPDALARALVEWTERIGPP
jgi:alpha-beta hydrolase superfamily lysophospholipase